MVGGWKQTKRTPQPSSKSFKHDWNILICNSRMNNANSLKHKTIDCFYYSSRMSNLNCQRLIYSYHLTRTHTLLKWPARPIWSSLSSETMSCSEVIARSDWIEFVHSVWVYALTNCHGSNLWVAGWGKKALLLRWFLLVRSFWIYPSRRRRRLAHWLRVNSKLDFIFSFRNSLELSACPWIGRFLCFETA